MKFQHYDIGYLREGETIEVNLEGDAAHVKMLDTENYLLYRTGRKHISRGGLVNGSSIRLKVPYAGNWHVAVDLGINDGMVSSLIKLISV